MGSPILGLHHVTATVDAPQADVDFAAGILGLRLVKKTVNFDNPFVYHLYYGDRVGTPGTIWTTFPYAGQGIRQGRIGAGQVTATTFAVPPGALEFWRHRLSSQRIDFETAAPRFGETGLLLRDPSGLQIEIVETGSDAREPWVGASIPREAAISGIHSVTLTSRAAAGTIDFMKEALGFRVGGTEGSRTRMLVAEGRPGQAFDVLDSHGSQPGSNGLGTVHHVAMAVATPDEQLMMRDRLTGLGVMVTPVQDRQYFRSIYFREPGGVLFEIATTAPGFMVDEPVEELGRALRLPPWEEPNRATIEGGLTSIVHPQAAE